MNRYLFAALVLTSAMVSIGARTETIKPIKASKHDMAGAIFSRSDAVKKATRVKVVAA